MNATTRTTRLGFLAAACAMTLALLMGVGAMATPNTAEAWVAKATSTASNS